jgi:hypothetical protein
VYWFPLDGNLTREGITADLEAMAGVGIGGFIYMETAQGTPSGPAAFAGPLWRDLFKHACQEAARLGLTVRMNNDAGWCGSGGPWITPELSMQKVVWTETTVKGGKPFDGQLEQPEAYQNYYRDLAVLAFPEPTNPAKISGIKGKACFVPIRGSLAGRANWPTLAADRVIAKDAIVDLTARMDAAGKLTWNVPAGNWTILRFGRTSTGKENHPAPEAGKGLECDKLSKRAAEVHFEGLMGKLIADVGPLAGTTLAWTHIDSWEVGTQNWTDGFREEFKRRRGYDILPLLPVMTGLVVDSLEISERFLWDLRQTISELLLENYAGHFRQLAHDNGLKLSIEAYTTCPTDEMSYAGRCDEPMAEFWQWKKYQAAFSCTAMASAAHVWGQPIVGAEAFTSRNTEKWLSHPGNIKDLGDWAFCEGINRFIFHRYAHQPWTRPDRLPGMSMGPWGLHYERTQTWWEFSKPWHEYLARCQVLLQQGRFVADICLLGPEGSPQTIQGQRAFGINGIDDDAAPLERPGHNFDTCPPEAILTQASVKDGRIEMKSGAIYRILMLPKMETMTPALLRKIKELVAAGATIAGNRPLKSPSLTDFPAGDRTVRALADGLWGKGESPDVLTERAFGKGRVFHGGPLNYRLPSLDLENQGIAKAQWIWRNEGRPRSSFEPGTRYFRHVFKLDDAVITKARLSMTADNTFECWINGVRVLGGTHFRKAYTTDVAEHLKPGENVIAVAAVNTLDTPNPAGLLGALSISFENKDRHVIRTGESWLAAERVSEDWNTKTGPTADWTAALEQGPAGCAPWGDIDDSITDADLFHPPNLVSSLLEQMGVPQDFRFRTQPAGITLRYTHRTLEDRDIYFVANAEPQTVEALCTFRAAGERPELWNPESGVINRPAAYDRVEGLTRLPLRLEPYGSVFVVFRKQAKAEAERVVSVHRDAVEVLSTRQPSAGMRLVRRPNGAIVATTTEAGPYRITSASGKTETLQTSSAPGPIEIQGPWSLRFAPGNGVPESIQLDELISWSDHTEPAVKYHSGSATYSKKLMLDSDALSPPSVFTLDLGEVEIMARVVVNGKDLGILWKRPFQIVVTEALQAGENLLEIEVVNLWINRMIGDEHLPGDSRRNPNGTLEDWPAWLDKGKPSPTGRHTFTTWRLWKKDDPLQPSGLLGPVRILTKHSVTLP